MSSKLIEMEGILVEAEVSDDAAREIAGGAAEKVAATLDKITPVLRQICRPINQLWKEIETSDQSSLDIDQAEVQLALGFEGEGNVYIAKAKANATLAVKLTLKPREPENG